MADGEAPAYSSIQARIAALNLNQVGRTPDTPPPSYEQSTNGTNGTNGVASEGRRKPPPPPLPKRPARANGTHTPSSDGLRPPPSSRPGSTYTNSEYGDEASPALPPRRPSSTQASDAGTPSLPPRRPSGQLNSNAPRRTSTATLGRRGSQESIASTTSVMSSRTTASTASKHRVRAPEYDPSSLPPLPARRKKEEEKEPPQLPLRSTISAPGAPSRVPTQNGDHDRPPLPSRPRSSVNNGDATPPPLPGNRPGNRPGLPSRPATNGSAPPPVPMSSRPNLSAINASKPRASAPPASCLICRDFSGPDEHAKRFPRESIPSQDPVWLGRELAAPFTDAADKGRALFTWLHHNINYDTYSFFNNCVRGSTPQSTLQSGLAVCEGYAGLFNAMARGAGIESVVVGGHGKGYGYDAKSGKIPPRSPTGHAWNAFRLDDGTWKLIDCCWGAGHICGDNQLYKRSFSPEMFTMSNDDFTTRHYPENPAHFFLPGGQTLTWEEYILRDSDAPKTWSGWEKDHGWKPGSVTPYTAQIPVTGRSVHEEPNVRFSFTKICPHWDGERAGVGKPYLPFIEIHGRGGASQEQRPLQTDGYNFWVDVPRAELGTPGQVVKIIYMQKLDNEDARGLTAAGYKRWKDEPRGKSWQWGILGEWTLS